MAIVYSLVTWGGKGGKSVTVNASTDLVSNTANGARSGQALVFASGTLPTVAGTALVIGTTYFAKPSTADAFELYYDSGLTSKINFTSTGSSLVMKSAFMYENASSIRWGAPGSELIYSGLNACLTARSSSTTGFDQEVVEIGDGFYDPISGTLIITGSPNTLITSMVNGARSAAFHNGRVDAGWVGTCPGADVNLGTGSNFEGLSVRPTSASGLYLAAVNASVRNSVFFSSGTRTGTGLTVSGQKCSVENNIFYNLDQGLVNAGADQSVFANNIAVKNNYGIRSSFDGTTNRFGFWYNNICIGNLTHNWGVKPTTLSKATNNFGASGDTNAPWVTGSGTTGTVATSDFAGWASNDFRPASASSPQVEAGLAYYAIPASDILDAFRPNYMNGGAAEFDAGPFEFDHGYGPWPETLLTIGNLLSGATARVFASGTQTVLAENVSTGTSWTPTGLTSGTVDVTILKDGYIPLRFTGVILESGSVVPVDGTQTIDRAYQASTDLVYGTTATVDTAAKRFALTAATTGQNWYSFWAEQYRNNAALYNKPFPLQANGPNSFTLRLDYEFSAGLSYITRDGIRYVASDGTPTAVWAALLSVGVPSGLQVRYEQSDGGNLSAASNTGNIDQLIQVYGDATHGNFDRRSWLVMRVQAEGYDQAEVDVVAQYGTLEDQLYVIALIPQANGVAAANPTVSSVTITDHGASPATWNSKAFSITITDSGTTPGQTIMQWIRRAQDVGGTFQGKDGFNWHDLVQTNGDRFKGVRGALYGDTGATLKGVRVLRGADAHPDFTLHTADDGSTVSTTPPAQAVATILANSRVQLYNVTTSTELDNSFQTGTTYANTLTAGVSVGDTLRLRVCKLGYEEAEAFAVWTTSGCTFLVNQSTNAVYAAWGIDGSTVTEFSGDVTGHIYIDSNDPDGATTKTRLGAWYSWVLTTEIGIRHFYKAVTYLAANAIRVNVDVADIMIENVNATTALRFTDTDVRLYRSDGSSIIAPTSYSIHNDYSGVPDVSVVTVSGSNVITGDIADIPAAVLGASAGSRTVSQHLQAQTAILANKMITNPATGKITVYADDSTTPLLTADIFKDAAGTTPYNGTGAERREKLA